MPRIFCRAPRRSSLRRLGGQFAVGDFQYQIVVFALGKFEHHFEECSPCLEKYGLEQAVKKLVKRCCGHDDVPTDLRSKVMGRIDLIRSGQAVPEHDVATGSPAASGPQEA